VNGGHFIFTLVGAVVISVGLAMQGDYNQEQRLYRIGYYLMTSMAWIIGLSWVMRFIHG
jgi:uncharacterized membrane protein